MSNATVTLDSQAPATKGIGYLLARGEEATPPIVIEGVIRVGRNADNDIVLADPHLSASHAQFEKRPTGFYVRDLKSRNGTFINGIKVSEAELLPGSRIQLGSREFEFSLTKPEPLSQNEMPIKSQNPSWSSTLLSLPQIAVTGLPVFLQGESGSGKEVIARLIHEMSTRKQAPFVSVNCSALSESLVESELFGHVKGSFTGATNNRKGAFEEARGGTLFLDEIGDLPISLQPKLLRALENKEIRPVGSDRTISTDVRIVTATHKSLESLISEGAFRSDLYYRIHVLKVFIPSLRHRMEDFENLVYIFAKDMRVRLSVSAIERLKQHAWPGNIRELKNVIARLGALFPRTHIQASEVDQVLDSPLVIAPASSMAPQASVAPQSSGLRLPFIKEVEREMIRQRLIANNGNQRKTAADLGMAKSTLHDRIKFYGIKVRDE